MAFPKKANPRSNRCFDNGHANQASFFCPSRTGTRPVHKSRGHSHQGSSSPRNNKCEPRRRRRVSEQRQNGGKRVGSPAGQPRAVTQPGRTDTDEDPLPSQRQQSANRFPCKRNFRNYITRYQPHPRCSRSQRGPQDGDITMAEAPDLEETKEIDMPIHSAPACKEKAEVLAWGIFSMHDLAEVTLRCVHDAKKGIDADNDVEMADAPLFNL